MNWDEIKMDFSRKAPFQLVLAFLLGCAICGLFASLVFHGRPAINSAINTKPVKVVTISAAKKPPRPIQHFVKQTQYDKPSYFSSWVSPDAPEKAVLLCVHGLALYS